jgi:3-methyladenine DNA glycosylase AlkD
MAAARKASAKKTASRKTATKKAVAKKSVSKSAATTATPSAEDVVAWLRKSATKATRDGMARYGIPADHAFGVPVNVMLKKAKEIGRNHELSLALWKTGFYEARMMASYVSEPERMTAAQMDAWCDDFDSWAIVDTVAWHAFEKSPHAWKKITQWSRAKGEFQKRASIALLATMALHIKTIDDDAFADMLPLVERMAQDERNFVYKGANWALRAIGLRSERLRHDAGELAAELSESANAWTRWVGKDALKKLAKPVKKKAGS